MSRAPLAFLALALVMAGCASPAPSATAPAHAALPADPTGERTTTFHGNQTLGVGLGVPVPWDCPGATFWVAPDDSTSSLELDLPPEASDVRLTLEADSPLAPEMRLCVLGLREPLTLAGPVPLELAFTSAGEESVALHVILPNDPADAAAQVSFRLTARVLTPAGATRG